MWPSRESERVRIYDALKKHHATVQPLPGAATAAARKALSLQIVASLRREDYYAALQKRPVAAFRADPADARFDPEKAVVFHLAQNNREEAFWLIFLMTHFAKPVGTGWLRLTDFYSKLGAGCWDWATVQKSPKAVDQWLQVNWSKIRGKFGNHRKYESLEPGKKRYMGDVVESYVAWVGQGGHDARFAQLIKSGSNDAFDTLYHDLSVRSFGRLARFDYLMLISRYGILNISPTSAYLEDATGPKGGVSLLFTGSAKGALSAQQLQAKLSLLDEDLAVGMSVLEDALCNWQKNPDQFVHFKG